MKRALLAIAAAGAMAALLVPLVATAKKPPKQPARPEPGPDDRSRAEPGAVREDDDDQRPAPRPGQRRARRSSSARTRTRSATTTGSRRSGPTTTDANGDYSFTVTPELNTNYRTRTTDVNPEQVSGPVFVRVKMRITRSVDDRTPDDGPDGHVLGQGRLRRTTACRCSSSAAGRPGPGGRSRASALEPGPAGEDSSAYTTR